MKKLMILSLCTAVLLLEQTIECSFSWKSTAKTTGKIVAGGIVVGAANIGYDVNKYINQCDQNCQIMQDALDSAIALHKKDPSGTADTVYAAEVTPPFGIAARIRCREEYELKHPGVFQTTPTHIGGTEDGNAIFIIIAKKPSNNDNSYEI